MRLIAQAFSADTPTFEPRRDASLYFPRCHFRFRFRAELRRYCRGNAPPILGIVEKSTRFDFASYVFSLRSGISEDFGPLKQCAGEVGIHRSHSAAAERGFRAAKSYIAKGFFLIEFPLPPGELSRARRTI
jgi:hypothetical protein